MNGKVLEYKLVIDTGGGIAKLQALSSELKSLGKGVGLEGVASSSGKAASALDNVGVAGARAGEKVKKGLLDSTRQSSELEKVLQRVQRTFVAFLAVGALKGIYDGMKSLVTIGVEYNRTLETSRLGIASLLVSQGQFIDASGKQLKGVEAISAAQQMSSKIVQELNIENLKTAATLEQLVKVYQQTLGPAMAQGFNVKQVKEFTTAVVQAAGAIGMNMDMLAEETRSLLTGAISARTSYISVALGITPKDIKQYQGDTEGLFKFLMDKLAAFRLAGEESKKTFSGLWSNLKDAFKMALGEAGSPMFDYLKGIFKELQDYLIDIDEVTKTITINPEAVERFRVLTDMVQALLIIVENLAKGFGYLVDGINLAVNAVRGVIGLIKEAASGAENLFLKLIGLKPGIKDLNDLINKQKGVKVSDFLGGTGADLVPGYSEVEARANMIIAIEEKLADRLATIRENVANSPGYWESETSLLAIRGVTDLANALVKLKGVNEEVAAAEALLGSEIEYVDGWFIAAAGSADVFADSNYRTGQEVTYLSNSAVTAAETLSYFDDGILVLTTDLEEAATELAKVEAQLASFSTSVDNALRLARVTGKERRLLQVDIDTEGQLAKLKEYADQEIKIRSEAGMDVIDVIINTTNLEGKIRETGELKKNEIIDQENQKELKKLEKHGKTKTASRKKIVDEELKELERLAEKVKEESLSPWEKLTEQQAKIDTLFQKGMINAEQYAIAVSKIAQEYQLLNRELAKHTAMSQASASMASFKMLEYGMSIDEVYEISKAVDKFTQDSAKEIKEWYEDLRSETSDFFYDVFTEGVEGFENFAERVKNLFVRLLADMAAQAVLQPIVIPIALSIGNALGGAGVSMQMLMRMGYPQEVASQMVREGATAPTGLPGLGFISKGLGYELPAGLGTVGNVLGNIGIGAAVGNVINPGMAGTIGGGLGGALGGWGGAAIAEVAASALTTGAMGAGAMIGSAFPVVGTILGAIAGGFISKLFGGKEPDDADLHIRFGMPTKPWKELAGPSSTDANNFWDNLGRVNIRKGDYMSDETSMELEETLASYYEEFFDRLDKDAQDALLTAIADNPIQIHFDDFEKYFKEGAEGIEGVIDELNEKFFAAYGDAIEGSLLGPEWAEFFDAAWLKDLEVEGETIADTFMRFVDAMEVVPDSLAYVKAYVEEGKTEVEAIQQTLKDLETVKGFAEPIFSGFADYLSEAMTGTEDEVKEGLAKAIGVSLENIDWTDAADKLRGDLEASIKQMFYTILVQNLVQQMTSVMFTPITTIVNDFAAKFARSEITLQEAMDGVNLALQGIDWESATTSIYEFAQGLATISGIKVDVPGSSGGGTTPEAIIPSSEGQDYSDYYGASAAQYDAMKDAEEKAKEAAEELADKIEELYKAITDLNRDSLPDWKQEMQEVNDLFTEARDVAKQVYEPAIQRQMENWKDAATQFGMSVEEMLQELGLTDELTQKYADTLAWLGEQESKALARIEQEWHKDVVDFVMDVMDAAGYLTDLDKALFSANKQFDEWEETIRALGRTEEEVDAALKALKPIKDQYIQSLIDEDEALQALNETLAKLSIRASSTDILSAAYAGDRRGSWAVTAAANAQTFVENWGWALGLGSVADIQKLGPKGVIDAAKWFGVEGNARSYAEAVTGQAFSTDDWNKLYGAFSNDFVPLINSASDWFQILTEEADDLSSSTKNASDSLKEFADNLKSIAGIYRTWEDWYVSTMTSELNPAPSAAWYNAQFGQYLSESKGGSIESFGSLMSFTPEYLDYMQSRGIDYPEIFAGVVEDTRGARDTLVDTLDNNLGDMAAGIGITNQLLAAILTAIKRGDISVGVLETIMNDPQQAKTIRELVM